MKRQKRFLAAQRQRLVRGLPRLLAASMAASLSVSFFVLDRPITVVRVGGELNDVQRARVEASVARNLDGGILTLDLDDLAHALHELDWLRSVDLRRVYPDRLDVQVVRASAIARWNDDRLLGDDGRLHGIAGDDDLGHLPRLAGPDALASEVLRTFVVLSEMASAAGVRVNDAGVNTRGEWRLVIDDGIELKLGRDDVIERAERAFALHRRELSSRRADIAALDARYSDGVAVKPRQRMAANQPRGLEHGG